MPKKTTILIVILAIVTGVLIFLAVRSDQGQNLLSNDQEEATPTQTQPFASLSFENPLIDASTGPVTQSVNVVIDTLGKPAAGAQIELSYNPIALTNVSIKAPQASFFGPNPSVLISNVDPTQGRISYAVGISATDAEKAGKGTIATITFTVNRLAGISTTNLTFLPKSAVTTLSSQGSILNTSTPLEIRLTPQPATN